MSPRPFILALGIALMLGSTSTRAQFSSPRPSPFGSPSQARPTTLDTSKLLDGVKTIPRLGAPGPVVAYGPQAVPVLKFAARENESALAVAAPLGKGRVLIFGHNSYLGGEASEGDIERLLTNAARWCSGKEKPRVGIKGAKSAPIFEKAGFRLVNMDKLDKRTLHECDVLIYNAQGLTDPGEAALLQEYIAAGGGFISGITGWAFNMTSGKDFAIGFRGNDLLAPAGVAWTDASAGDAPIAAVTEVNPALNASTALALLTPKLGTAPAPIPPTQLQQAAHTIALALPAMPAASRAPFQHAVALATAGSPVVIPTKEKPLDITRDAAARAAVSLQARLAQFVAPADLKPHPAAAVFPGRVTPQGRPVAKVVTIDPAIPGWQSTGLYADAGARITIKLPPEFAGQGYAVRIGSHTDDLSKLEQWKRVPQVSTSTSLSAADTTTGNAFGGLVYIVVPDKPKLSTAFKVSITGAVESPLFILGQSTDAQWQQQLGSAAPWAELACPGVILSVPIAVARGIKNPTELMKYWQRVVEAEDDLSNVASQRRRPERIVPDVQISAGFMHSGYPIMIHLPQAQEMTSYDGKNVAPGWGFYHELGHNHQRPEWTPEGTTEVTCNLFSLYIFEHVLGRAKETGHPGVTTIAQDEHWQKYVQSGKSYATWKSDPFLALTIYIQLIDGFGFDTLKKVIRSYQGNDFGPSAKTETEKIDQWMVRYSKISGKNLAPLFETWGIPITSAAKAEVASLPGWMPKGFPK